LLEYILTDGTAAACLPTLRRLQPRSWIVVYTANCDAARRAGVTAKGADLLIEKVSVMINELLALALSRGVPPSGRDPYK
jgi:hypothetical protein